ncbi:MAG: LysR family transcriptional regulator [Pseudomonadota bacterium]
MDIDGLRLFVRAAEMLNISAAGRSLGMAPAVASAKLAKLERELGAELLRRSTRKVALSVDGGEFLPYAREILAQEQAGRAALGLETLTPSGVLRFAAPSSFAQRYVVPLIGDFLSAYPKVSLDLRFSDSQFDLIEGSFDLALRNQALADSSFRARKLADDRRILCASPGYLATFGTPTHPDDLAAHRLIAFRDLAARPLVDADGARAVFDPAASDCRLVVDDGVSQRLATVAGLGVSMNSLWSVHDDLRGGALVRLLPEYASAEDLALWLVYPKSNVLTAKVRVLIDFLLARIGTAPPWAA